MSTMEEALRLAQHYMAYRGKVAITLQIPVNRSDGSAVLVERSLQDYEIARNNEEGLWKLVQARCADAVFDAEELTKGETP